MKELCIGGFIAQKLNKNHSYSIYVMIDQKLWRKKTLSIYNDIPTYIPQVKISQQLLLLLVKCNNTNSPCVRLHIYHALIKRKQSYLSFHKAKKFVNCHNANNPHTCQSQSEIHMFSLAYIAQWVVKDFK